MVVCLWLVSVRAMVSWKCSFPFWFVTGRVDYSPCFQTSTRYSVFLCCSERQPSDLATFSPHQKPKAKSSSLASLDKTNKKAATSNPESFSPHRHKTDTGRHNLPFIHCFLWAKRIEGRGRRFNSFVPKTLLNKPTNNYNNRQEEHEQQPKKWIRHSFCQKMTKRSAKMTRKRRSASSAARKRSASSV